jgi:3-oxoacyl-[acyl-carrier-protein] synthase II
MQLKRVVVTGLGALTPIGNSVKEYWEALISGKSGAGPITYFDTEKHKSKFACEVKNFNIEEYMDRKESRKLDKFAQYAVAVSDEAIKDAGITLENTDKHRIGVIWGAGIGGIQTFQEEVLYYGTCDGVPKFNPYFIPKMIADIAPAHVSMRNGYMGPNYTTVSACASSANALIDAFNYIRLGMCDVIISGGSEAAVTISGMGGFSSLHALSTRNESPETASRPFDATRDGFVLGEGAGALVLEEYEHAKARGAKIYCEVGGGGMSSDAYHITAPHPEGIGVIAVMENTLRDAGLKPEQVDHINTHGTSTPLGDVAELKAISHVFGSHAKNININSTKSMTGHLLGAAGAIEAIASILAMQHGIVPPTINHTTVDENIDPSLNLTLNKPQKREINVAMSNTFGFGGHNACVLFKKYV